MENNQKHKFVVVDDYCLKLVIAKPNRETQDKI